MNCIFCKEIMMPGLFNYHNGWLCNKCPYPVIIEDYDHTTCIMYRDVETDKTYNTYNTFGITTIYYAECSWNIYNMLEVSYKEMIKSELLDITPSNVKEHIDRLLNLKAFL